MEALYIALEQLEPADAVEFAQQFRSCARGAIVGPDVFAADGAYVVRCLADMGYREIIADMGLACDMDSLVRAAERTVERGATGVTVAPFFGTQHYKRICQRVKNVVSGNQSYSQPATVTLSIPSDKELIARTRPYKAMRSAPRKALMAAVQAPLDAIKLTYPQMKVVTRDKYLKSRLPQLLVYATKLAPDFREFSRTPVTGMSVTEMYRAGIKLVVFSSRLLGKNANYEWAADMLAKDLEIYRQETTPVRLPISEEFNLAAAE